MKKIKFLLLTLVVFLIPINSVVKAASSCSYEEQVEFNNLAANVSYSYEATDIYSGKAINIDGDEEEVDIYVRGLKITILNITDDIYVKLINNRTRENKIYYNKDTQDGVLTITTDDVDEITDYKLEVYANKYSCAGELYRSATFTTPRYNYYSSLSACDDNPGFYYCQEFINSEDISLGDFTERLEKYRNEQEEEPPVEKGFWQKLIEFYKNHMLVKKRRSRIL